MDFKQIRLICLIVFIELCFLGQVILCQNSSTCIYPNVTQSCCNGGDFIFTTPTGPPECYDSSIDLCGNSSLIGDAKIKGSNVTWDNSDESCYCYYDLEICEPEAETLNCITQSVQTCCADQANTDIELTCTDYEDDASNCANTLTYDCASAATQAICSDTDGTTNTPDGYDYFNGNYETVVYWWFDQIDDTLDGKCYCIYEYFSQNELCPSPTAAPTIVGDVETTGGEIDYFAEFDGQFEIGVEESEEIDCDYDWEKFVFEQILETASYLEVMNISCTLNDNIFAYQLNVTAKWEERSEYSSDLSAVDRLQDKPLNEIVEYGPSGIVYARLTGGQFICAECYKLDASNLNKPYWTMFIMFACVIFNFMCT